MTRTVRSARKELRALVEGVLAREPALTEDVRRRIVNRLLRQSDRIAEIALALRTAEPTPTTAAAATAAAPPPPFDPYAIAVVATLQRAGAEALLDRLSAITSVENLVSLATAQNLALERGWSNADELRVAIVRSAERRLADRRAAAS